MSYAAFLQLTAAPAWLALSESERARIVAAELAPIFARHGGDVRTSYYDAEAFSARPSDLLMLEFETPGEHAPLIDALRRSPIFAEPYSILDQLVVGERAEWLEAGAAGANEP